MPKFEAHITVHIKDAELVKRLAEGTNYWKYSQIEGDALMGPKPYCYLTGYDVDAGVLLASVGVAVTVLRQGGVDVLREKIERIIFDTKTGVNEL
jgi:hypothetical protein